jgi:HlyD family secretion protein
LPTYLDEVVVQDVSKISKLYVTPAEPPREIQRSRIEPPHRWLIGFFRGIWAWKWQALGTIAAVWLAISLGGPIVLGARVTVDRPVVADFVQTVVASGHVEAPFRVDIGTQITGVVADVPVAEGQFIKSGETLIVLDDREAQGAVVQAEGVVAQAQARLRQLRELTLPSAEQTLRQAQATRLNAQKTYDRAAKLAANGYTTRAALDEATKNLDIAKTQVNNAEYQVFTSRPGGSDYVMAETQLNQARASLSTAESRLSYTIVRAPREGTLIARDVERGSVVQPGKVLMKLSPAGETQLVVLIDEKNLGLITVGQRALVSADAFANEIFPAEVIFINPGIDLQRASVEVKLRVPNPAAYLRQDMTVSVDIEVARRPQAMVLMVNSIRDSKSGNPWVMKVVEGRATRQPIQLGIVSGGKAEIVAGLAATDLIIPAANAAIKERQRVRADVAAGTAR